MDDLIAFLRARLDEDEQTARSTTAGPWTVKPVMYGSPDDGWGEPTAFEVVSEERDVVMHQLHEGGGIDHLDDAIHIARHDPARVLREVEAKRVVLQQRERLEAICSDDWTGLDAVEEILKAFAAAYCDHPGYRDDWRP